MDWWRILLVRPVLFDTGYRIRLPERIAYSLPTIAVGLGLLVFHCRNYIVPEYLARDQHCRVTAITRQLMLSRTRLYVVASGVVGKKSKRGKKVQF